MVVDGVVDPAAQIRIPLAMMNRHGLVAGATGTGKTKTLQVIAEQLSAAGVPVVMADVKGDLSGLSRPGEPGDRTTQRAQDTGDDGPDAVPRRIPSLGTKGIGVPVRATISLIRPDPAVKGSGAQRNPGVHPRPDLPLGRPAGLPLLDLGSSVGDHPSHQR